MEKEKTPTPIDTTPMEIPQVSKIPIVKEPLGDV